ncbi:MAG: hypothetical protein DRH37_07680 [Deltaproteobacteria bacterium]|nr:MAG: hypothetical protein DRH37_07680 [Deltaproteobacteria bacterium]
MPERKKTLVSLKDIISELLQSNTLPFDPDDARIWKVWEDVVGPVIARYATPLRIRHKKLRVRVTDPIWYQELKFMEKDIRERLNHELGRTAVAGIDFRVGAPSPDD